MGKIVATYLVKVTLREPDTDEGELAKAATEDPPTNTELAEAVQSGIGAVLGFLTVNATSERTDK